MKRYVIIGGVAAIILIITGVALFAGSSSQTDRSDEPTASDQQQSSTDQSSSSRDQDSPSADTQTGDDRAQYIDYSQESFAAHADSQRILVFTSTTDQASGELDSLLSASLTELPGDVVMYKTDTDKHKDVADQFGAQPGVAIKFNSDGRLGGIYVAPESPDLAVFMTSLQLDEQAADSPIAN